MIADCVRHARGNTKQQEQTIPTLSLYLYSVLGALASNYLLRLTTDNTTGVNDLLQTGHPRKDE